MTNAGRAWPVRRSFCRSGQHVAALGCHDEGGMIASDERRATLDNKRKDKDDRRRRKATKIVSNAVNQIIPSFYDF